MTKLDIKELPDINCRLRSLIEKHSFGNVRRFCQIIGLSDSSKINRLFNKDKNNGRFPIPSTEIVILICNKLGYTTDWLLRGVEPKCESKDCIKEDENTIKTKEELMSIIKQQSQQIGDLVKIVLNRDEKTEA